MFKLLITLIISYFGVIAALGVEEYGQCGGNFCFWINWLSDFYFYILIEL